MGDSTAMTIQFLRARLLSERSVSRSARQRADHLAKRVRELEDQVREVMDQRQQAEKAANEVLSILESRGIAADFSEVMDSCSDQEIAPEEEGKCSFNSELDGNDDEASIEDGTREQSDAGAASSPQGGTLSWKSRSSSSDSLKNKMKEEQAGRRQRLSLISKVGSSSSTLHLGKSCRKIKNTAGVGLGRQEDGKSPSDPANDFGGKEGMERAIERQDQLIDRFIAEENAQREWEQKFEDPDGEMESTIGSEQHDENTSELQAATGEEALDPSPADKCDEKDDEAAENGNSAIGDRPPSDHGGEMMDRAREAEAEESEGDRILGRNPSAERPCSSSAGSDGRRAATEAWALVESSVHDRRETNRGAEKILGALQLARLSLRREMQRSEPRRGESPAIEIPFGASTLFRLPSEINSSKITASNLATTIAAGFPSSLRGGGAAAARPGGP
ncbi:uncharacterized protein LOC144705770 isoform X2 [Wolffia australiana]